MSNRKIEQLLLSLMPTQNAPPPPSLVELASAILAHSRQKACVLKADEEIARSYACAHLACDRLKTSLDLPEIVVRPPIMPSKYARLYGHLDKVIPNTSLATGTKHRTPSKLRDTGSTPWATPTRGTSFREKSLSQFRTPSKAGDATPKRLAANTPAGEGLSPWIQPVIRFIARETGMGWLAPTVLAGMEAIVVPGGQRTKDKWICSTLSALLLAIHFLSAAQVSKLTSGVLVDADNYVPMRKNLLAMLGRARKEAKVKVADDDAAVTAWEGFTPATTRSFDRAIEEVTKRRWLESDWFRGLTDIAEARGRADAAAASWQDTESVTGTPTAAPVRRADTMIQEDFLSEAKRARYRIWKADVLARIKNLEDGQVRQEQQEQQEQQQQGADESTEL